jgi:hypothetical protein
MVKMVVCVCYVETRHVARLYGIHAQYNQNQIIDHIKTKNRAMVIQLQNRMVKTGMVNLVV